MELYDTIIEEIFGDDDDEIAHILEVQCEVCFTCGQHYGKIGRFKSLPVPIVKTEERISVSSYLRDKAFSQISNGTKKSRFECKCSKSKVNQLNVLINTPSVLAVNINRHVANGVKFYSPVIISNDLELPLFPSNQAKYKLFGMINHW